jgi:hypothetical protein
MRSELAPNAKARQPAAVQAGADGCGTVKVAKTGISGIAAVSRKTVKACRKFLFIEVALSRKAVGPNIGTAGRSPN